MKILKKLLLFTLTFCILICFIGCDKLTKKSSLTKVSLSVTTLDSSYAPLIVAINNKYFEAEGLDVAINYIDSDESVTNQVMSDICNIGMCGSEYASSQYKENKKDYPVFFATINNTNANYIISREEEKDMSVENLRGKTIISNSSKESNNIGLEFLLNEAGITVGEDVNMINNIEPSYISSAFKSGTGDLALVNLDTALSLEKNNNGKRILSLGEKLGNYQNISFIAKKSYIDKHSDIIQKFTNALYKGQLYVNNHSPSEIAYVIKSSLPSENAVVVENSIKIFKDIGLWTENPSIIENNYNNMINIASNTFQKLKDNPPPYNKIINNSFAETSTKNIK